jgi:hypothetical protein
MIYGGRGWLAMQLRSVTTTLYLKVQIGRCRILFGRLLGKTPGQLHSGLATWKERVGRTGDLLKLTVG